MNNHDQGFLERLTQVIDHLFKSDSEFTSCCSLPHNFVTRAKANGYSNPTVETLLLIKKGIDSKTNKNISWKWLLEGKGAMFTGELNLNQSNGNLEKSSILNIQDFSISDLIRNHPDLNRKISLLISQVEMTREFLKQLSPNEKSLYEA